MIGYAINALMLMRNFFTKHLKRIFDSPHLKTGITFMFCNNCVLHTII